MPQTVQHSLLNLELDCFLIFYRNKPLSRRYLTAISCIYFLCNSWMCYQGAIKPLMSKIAYNIGTTRNASIIYCYHVREMVVIYVVPPCYCRNINPNVVSLSFKAWGPPWGAVKDSKPLHCQGTSVRACRNVLEPQNIPSYPCLARDKHERSNC